MSNTFGFIETKVSKACTNLRYPSPALLPFELFEDWELENYLGDEMEVDVECYVNWFLIKFRHEATEKRIVFEIAPDGTNINYLKLSWCLHAFKLITFNGNGYDIPMINLCLKGYDTRMLKRASDLIIVEKWKVQEIYEEFRVEPIYINHIDLKEVCPLQGSLKKYGARLHSERLQELPYDPIYPLTQQEALESKHYCSNDLNVTGLIKRELKEQLLLRADLSQKYGTDLRSKSDAQIAEAVITKEVEKVLGRKVKKPQLPEDYSCQYKAPDYIKFNTPQFAQAFEDIKKATFYLDKGGSPMWPVGLGEKEKNKKGEWVWVLKVRMGSGVYKIGMGGLHSSEKSVGYKSDAEYILLDRDVASYYPFIILTLGLFPAHLGPAFLKVYRDIVDRRIAAKKQGKSEDLSLAELGRIAAESLKIVINGGFGKFGSKYSNLYSPDLMLQVTITGQLCLMMLIEMLESVGTQVISANTDGVVSRVKRNNIGNFLTVVKKWENITGFETEETAYHSLYSKDVNNYIAIKLKEDKANKGQWLEQIDASKLKGAYGDPWSDKKLQIFRFHKNPTFQICTQAMQALIMKGTPIAHTIVNCRDVRQFLAARDVKGGGHIDGLFVGKFVRWYIGNNKNTINYIQSGNKVPDTAGAITVMDLPKEFPNDIDYDWYIAKTKKMLGEIGYYTKEQITGQKSFF